MSSLSDVLILNLMLLHTLLLTVSTFLHHHDMTQDRFKLSSIVALCD